MCFSAQIFFEMSAWFCVGETVVIMGIVLFLILFPFCAAACLAFLKRQSRFRDGFIITGCILIAAAAIYFSIHSLLGGKIVQYFKNVPTADHVILAGELLLMGFLIFVGVHYKRYYIILLSVLQTALVAWLELSGYCEPTACRIYCDDLTVMMCLIVGVIGSLICVYAVGYMKQYHTKHPDFQDRRPFFFAVLFLFLGAMFGLVLSNNLLWIYFFWEITSVCSFLLIGYNKTTEAIRNSFRALWMNLLGGLGFSVAIAYCALKLNVTDLHQLVLVGTGTKVALIPITLLAFAGLTKSAQLPFSGWLLGAMVAPTPTSAMLHSATMVKAGVYLLLRLSPTFAGNMAGVLVTTIGGFTFFATSALAISQSDGKKVLAYSTISNLGLITACAGVGAYEAVWAGILLMMFHAVSKSLMFLSVGAVENTTGSRNIEDMHGLIVRYPHLAFTMIIGIAGMFLAPFGMLISKWAALKAFVDTQSILLVVFLIFGSATTLFYWTKWLGKLVCVVHQEERQPNTLGVYEWFSLSAHTVIMIALCVCFPIVSSRLVEPFLSQMFHTKMTAIISQGNTNIMLMMLCMIVILPIAMRVLPFGKKNKMVTSYMGGSNTGDDRNFVNSFGGETHMYLANWYMTDIFGEKKIWKPSVVLATAALIVLMIVAVGGGL